MLCNMALITGGIELQPSGYMNLNIYNGRGTDSCMVIMWIHKTTQITKMEGLFENHRIDIIRSCYHQKLKSKQLKDNKQDNNPY